MNPLDDTDYNYADSRCVVRRIAKDNSLMFNYYNKELLRRGENNLYYIFDNPIKMTFLNNL